jgi:hypothetical protein
MSVVRSASLLVAAFALSVAASGVHAATIIHSTGFTIADGAVPAMALPTFDPGLGTLDSVHIDIDGSIAFLGEAGPGQVLAPSLSLAFGRIGPAGFDAFTGMLFLSGQPNPNPGAIASLPFATNFSFDVTFNFFSDLLGFAVPSLTASAGAAVPPSSADALRADFLDNQAMQPVMQFLVFRPSNFTLASPIDGGGSFTITYDFTPTPDPVAEPLSLALFGLGLAGLGAAGRQRRRPR